MNRSSVTRRCLLATLGGSATAGCLSRSPFKSESGIRLGSVRVYNSTDAPITVDLQVERDKDIVYHDNNELDSEEFWWIEPTWSSEPAEYDIYYVVNDRVEIMQGRIDEQSDESTDGECMFVDISIRRSLPYDSIITRPADEYEEATCNF